MVPADDVEAIATALQTDGICVISGLPSTTATDALRCDLQALLTGDALQPASIGRGPARTRAADVRGDRTVWLDDPRCAAAAAAHLATLDALRSQLNRRLFLGLDDVEAHYAAYAPGAGYARHRDRFRDNDARVLSLVSYLNPDWLPAHGGQLRVHAAHGALEIMPMAGTSVCFLSELEHEVLPATRERLSIAAWMRRT